MFRFTSILFEFVFPEAKTFLNLRASYSIRSEFKRTSKSFASELKFPERNELLLILNDGKNISRTGWVFLNSSLKLKFCPSFTVIIFCWALGIYLFKRSFNDFKAAELLK